MHNPVWTLRTEWLSLRSDAIEEQKLPISIYLPNDNHKSDMSELSPHFCGVTLDLMKAMRYGRHDEALDSGADGRQAESIGLLI